MNNATIGLIILLVCCVVYFLFKIWELRKIVDHYKYETEWAWPQYEKSGTWQDYKGPMSLVRYIECLEFSHNILGKILTNKVYNHIGHPYNERVLVLRSVIRDLKMMSNKVFGGEYKTSKEDYLFNTFWRKLK